MRIIGEDTKIMEGFSKRFVKLTKDNDPTLSNVELGKSLAVSSTTIFKWKNAQAMPKMANASLIALRYRVTIDWLLTGRKARSPAKPGQEELALIIDALSPDNLERVLDSARAFQALEKQKDQ